MSKQVDLEKPLSDEDRDYLESRAMHREIAENDARFADGDPVSERSGLTGEEPAYGVPAGSHPEAVGVGQGGVLARSDPAADRRAAESAADDEEDEYSEMTVAELQDELEKRDLPKSGKKAELAARLREDDDEEGGE